MTRRPRLTLAATAAAVAATAAAAAATAPPAAATAPPAAAAATASPPAAAGHPATAPPFAPGRVVVGYRPPIADVVKDIRSASGLAVSPAPGPATPTDQVVALPAGASVTAAAARIRRLSGVAYAVPDYLAHTAGAFIPNDRGRTSRAGGWQRLQWNFLATAGIDAPTGWANLIAAGRPGATGVKIAVIDTGVAFRNWRRFRRSPDFGGTRFVDACDLVAGKLRHGRCTNPFPLDREGHGTFVTGTLAEATNNGFGLTGLAYGASIMPIRVLDANGLGESSVIAQGIRYAVRRGAEVINLSLEFYLGITAGDIPEIISALRYAHAHGVTVVAAAGNDGATQIAYPAHVADVISVGATTLDRCLADYSDVGTGLDIVAPGGGDDSANLPADPDCHPDRNLPDVYQMTFNNPARPDRFSIPGGWYGTSMATPEVSAAAAMVIASGVIGRHPTPDQILARLETTAEPLGPTTPNPDFGYGLLNVGAATTRTAPVPTAPPPATSS